MDVRICL
jgi:heterogeneous nuclear ribonucleoprotein R